MFKAKLYEESDDLYETQEGVSRSSLYYTLLGESGDIFLDIEAYRLISYITLHYRGLRHAEQV